MVETVEDHGKSDSSTQQIDAAMDETAGQTEPTDTSEDFGVGRARAPESQGHSGQSSQTATSLTDEAGKVCFYDCLSITLRIAP